MDYNQQKEIEKAISFLVTSIETSGKNPKPVILHSIRVAMNLSDRTYDSGIIIGALLHDIVEDTDVTLTEVEKLFGERIAKLVDANSFDEDVMDRVEQYKQLFQKCVQGGREALIIKAADILDNSDYYNGNPELLEKMRYFIEISQGVIGGEDVWKELQTKYHTLVG